MRKNLRRIALITMLVFAVSQLAVVFAKEPVVTDYSQISRTQEAVEYLAMLGVIEGGEAADFMGSGPITKGEAANLIVKSLGALEAAQQMEPYNGFSDLSLSHKYASVVTYAVHNGILSGESASTLGLDKNITLEQAAKMLVCGLGYGPRAQMAGGYPAGYLSQANTLKLLQGVEEGQDGVLSRAAFSRMLYNAFKVPVFQLNSIIEEGDVYQSYSGETLEYEYLKAYDLVIAEGIVEASERTTIMSTTSLKDGAVIVGGVKLDAEGSKIGDYIGYRVQYVAKQAEDDAVGSVTGFRITNKNVVTYLDKNCDAVYVNGKIEYYDEETGRTEELEISPNAAFVYNNRMLTSVPSEKIDFGDGNVTVIDNDNDDRADVVSWTKSQSFTVSGISEANEMIYLADDTFNGNASIDMRERKNDNKTIVVRTVDGKAADWHKIQPESAISIIESEDKLYLEIILLPDPISGVASEIESGKWLKIEDKVYNTTSQLGEVKLNKWGHFYTNENGDIFKFESVNSEYVYLISKNQSSGLGGDMKIKIYSNDTGLNVYEVGDRINVDGVSYNTGKDAFSAIPEAAVVSLTIGGNGKVKTITSANPYGGRRERTYCKYAHAFNDPNDPNESDVPFKFNKDTMFFVVPSNMSDEDFGAIPDYKDGDVYDTQAFELDPDTDFVKALVITVDTDDFSNSTIGIESTVGIVSEITKVLDEDEQATYQIKGFAEGEEFVYTAGQYSDVFNVMAILQEGDVIRFNKNYSDQIVKVEKVVSLKDQQNPILPDSQGTFQSFYGNVMILRKSVITNLSKYLRHQLQVSANKSYNDMMTVEIYADTKNTENDTYEFNDYYIYDRSGKGKITPASIDDIVTFTQNPLNPSNVFIEQSTLGTQLVVIVKD